MAVKHRECRLCGAPVKADSKNATCNPCKNKERMRQAGEDLSKYIALKITWGKNNAKRRGLDFNLTKQELLDLYEEQKGLCALSGLPMTRSSDNSEYSLSIDRIDSESGYTKDNVQLVCWRINTMKSSLSVEMFKWWCKVIAKD